VFSFGISENIVFSNVIDSYHLVDERYISELARHFKTDPTAVLDNRKHRVIE
jgi:hypothetical protein